LIVLGSLVTIIGALASPIGIIIVLLVAIVATFVIFRKKIIENLKNLWSWITGLLKMAGDWLDKTLTSICDGIAKIWNDFWGLLFDIVVWVWEKILDFLGWAWETVKAIFTGAFDFLKPAWDFFWNSLLAPVRWVFDELKKIISPFFDWLLDLLGESMQLIFRLIDMLPFVNLTGMGPPAELGSGSQNYLNNPVPRFGPGSVPVPPQSFTPPPGFVAGDLMPGGATVNVGITIQGNMVGDEGFARQLAYQIQDLAWRGRT